MLRSLFNENVMELYYMNGQFTRDGDMMIGWWFWKGAKSLPYQGLPGMDSRHVLYALSEKMGSETSSGLTTLPVMVDNYR